MKNKALIYGELEVKVYDKNGELIKELKKPSDSFVKNVTNFLNLWLDGKWNVVLANGSSVELGFEDTSSNVIYSLNALAKKGDAYFEYKGIWIGRGSKAFSVTDYELDERFTTEFEAEEMVIVEKTDTSIVVQRSFNNVSGSDQTVNEIGFYTFAVYKVGGSYSFGPILICRDVITPVVVPNGGRITVKYKFMIE